MSVKIKNFTISDLIVGQTDEIKIDINNEDVQRFADLSGDYSPIHVDDNFAKEQGFDGRIVHGMLIGSYISQFVGMRLPGRYGILQSVDIGFRKPITVPARLSIEGEIVNISKAVGQVGLKIIVTDDHENLLATAKVRCIVRT